MLQPDEHVTTVMPIRDYKGEDKYLLLATKLGMIKRVELSAFANIRKTGIIAMTLREGDELIEVKFTEKDEDVYLVTRNGMSICFKETDIRPTGRSSMGVRGIELDEGDEVVSMQLGIQGDYMLIISEKGYGKRSALSDFRPQKRGGKGIKCYKISEKTGKVVGAKFVIDESEVLLITTEGIMIRTSVSDISVLGRITSGVKVMNLEEGVKVASFSKVKNDDRPEEPDGENSKGIDEADFEETDFDEDSEMNDSQEDAFSDEDAEIDDSQEDASTDDVPTIDKGIDELIQRAEDDSDK